MSLRAKFVARNGLESLGSSAVDLSQKFGSLTGFDSSDQSLIFGSTSIESLHEVQNGSNLTELDALAVIKAARFAAEKSVRTSTTILAAFNTIAAFATFAWILHESYQARKHAKHGQSMSGREFLSFVSSPDLFPLIVSGSITIQGTIFAVAQSRGLDGFAGPGCTLIAQFVLPGLLLVPTTQFVFGCELAIRALKLPPFEARGRRMVPICLAIIGLVAFLSFFVALFETVADRCFMSLLWYISDYAVGIFTVLVTYAAVILAIVVFILIKLIKTPKIEPTERVNASRMVYYLSLAVISIVLILPFFFVLAFFKNSWGEGPALALDLSVIAAVVASLSGLMTGGLHLFLRSSTISTIGPRNKSEETGRTSFKNKIRMGPQTSVNDDDSNGTSGSRGLERGSNFSSAYVKRTGEESAIEYPGLNSSPPGATASNPLVYSQVATLGKAPDPVQVVQGHRRKGSNHFSFPSRPQDASIDLLPSTTYDPKFNTSNAGLLEVPADDWSFLKPPPLAMLGTNRHSRESSWMSGATVQIGLRISNVNDMQEINTNLLNDAGKVHDIECPLKTKSSKEENTRPMPLVYGKSNLRSRHKTAKQQKYIDSDSGTLCETESEVPFDPAGRGPVKDAKTKMLPPVPMPEIADAIYKPQEEQVTLCPAIHPTRSPSSKTKLPSPQGVGFTTPPRKINADGSEPSTRTSEGSSIVPPAENRPQWI